MTHRPLMARSRRQKIRARQGSTFWSLVFHTGTGAGFLDQRSRHPLAGGRHARPLPGLCPAVDVGPRTVVRRLGPLDIRRSGPELAGRRPAGRSRRTAVSGRWRCRKRPVSRTSSNIAGIRRSWRQWPGMVLPWTLIAAVAVLLPFLSATPFDRAETEPRSAARDLLGHASRAPIWFAWWWAVGNLLVFCTWAVAKPNYYVPCLPGMALLIGATWLQSGAGGPRPVTSGLCLARGILQAQWVLMFVAAAVAPLVVRAWLPASLWPWSLAIAAAVAASVAVSVHAWRRGADALPLAPIAAACVMGILIAYGMIAPAENELRSHRVLAQKLHRSSFRPASARSTSSTRSMKGSGFT